MHKLIALLVVLLAATNDLTSQKLQELFFADEFDTPSSLSEWKRFYQVEGWPDMMKHIEVKNGFLIMEPNTSGWYADYHAPFVFKEVTGDFSVTTRLKISGLRTDIPETTWSLSGIMIRAPRNISPKDWEPNGENWMFLTTGFANDLNQPVFETKTTINSTSRLKLHPNKLDWVSLKIVRNGGTFTLFYRYDDLNDWNKIETFQRNDLPETLQVGLNAYTDFYAAGKELLGDYYRYNTTVVTYGKPDLRVQVDYFRIENR